MRLSGCLASRNICPLVLPAAACYPLRGMSRATWIQIPDKRLTIRFRRRRGAHEP